MTPFTRIKMAWALGQVRPRPVTLLAVKLEKMANVIFKPKVTPVHAPQPRGYVHPALRVAAHESPWEIEGPLADHLQALKSGVKPQAEIGTVVGAMAPADITRLGRQPGLQTMLSPETRIGWWRKLQSLLSPKTASLPRLFKWATSAFNPLHTGAAGGVSDAVATDAGGDALDDSGAESAGRPAPMGWKAQGGSYTQQTYALGAMGRAQRPSTTQAQGSAPATAAMAAPPVKLAAFFKRALSPRLKARAIGAASQRYGSPAYLRRIGMAPEEYAALTPEARGELGAWRAQTTAGRVAGQLPSSNPFTNHLLDAMGGGPGHLDLHTFAGDIASVPQQARPNAAVAFGDTLRAPQWLRQELVWGMDNHRKPLPLEATGWQAANRFARPSIPAQL